VATPRIAESVGRVLGDRYRLTRSLGVGASAHVYVAEDVSLRRRVAIKLLHPALAADEGFLRRFRAEAQVVAALRHPNILRIYDWGEDDATPYLVMELLEGGSLRALLDAGSLLTPAQAAAVGARAARALEYAHRRGLVHRDIKPANLIFDDEGRLTVADFGLARALAEATWTEPAGAVVGTARYAAPEQARGEALDSRADVYSLALVLIEATTGTVPFATDTTLGTLMARLERPVKVPDGVDLGGLGPILEAAGTIAAKDRMDAADLALALDGVAAWLPPPPPLPLVSPLVSGEAERDLSPTDYPGRLSRYDGVIPDGGPEPARADQTAAAQTGADQTAAAQATSQPPEPPSAASADATVYARRDQLDADLARPAPAPSPAEAGAVLRDQSDPPRRRRWLRSWLVAVLILALLGGGAAAVVLARKATPSHPVPRLTGDSQAAAVQALGPLHLHLAVTSRTYDPKAAAGSILTQSPATGARLKEGKTVDVTLSLGPQPVRVPTLKGDTEQVAQAVLANLGLKASPVTPQSSLSVGSGQVISSQPDSGTLLPGQSVALVVSTGKPHVPVPGMGQVTFANAQAAISAAGLVAVEQDTWSNSVPKAEVIGTSPPAGSSVVVGSPVTVIVSKGPHLVPVPDVRTYSVGTASQTLSAAGFQVSGVTGNPIATVVGTSPGVGSMAIYGSAVQIITG
jgi:serine/threonine-protein kinase